jgi:hypothetical protein
MEAIYIPEEDRCTDILSVVEDEDKLKYFPFLFSLSRISIDRNLVSVQIH